MCIEDKVHSLNYRHAIYGIVGIQIIHFSLDDCENMYTLSCHHHPIGSTNYLPLFNTLRPRQMDAISQTPFSNAFSWMKMFEFRLRFHWRLFLRFQITIFQHWFRYWLGAVQATSHYLKQWWLVYWRIYASLGLNELRSGYEQGYAVYVFLCSLLSNEE